MIWKECKSLIVSDLERLTNINKWGGVKSLLFNASFRITFWFRIGSYLITLKSATPFPKCYLHKEEWTFDS